MKILNIEQFQHIADCPLGNKTGEIELFRIVLRNSMSESFIPHAIKMPKLKGECKAWGLSLYKSEKRAIQALKNLSKKKAGDGIAVANISDSHGIKYQTGDDLTHFTFYPFENFVFLTEFKIIDHEE
ncbi:hypothetical protein [Myroides odoratimimus]|uniref:hypothetical protein n=1 Tax=Myroides odoratimimus TaxID=76832 RepID=UPI0031011B4C